ncbi:MAG: DUF937 domain-containing protein [Chlorobiaceae bacterium]|nr:DUF937 domain-containing protein [Chlorobiaceae bacterium]NTV59849.1 DUF937 domain-containing protein [Chlorobiaceae bacterium]
MDLTRILQLGASVIQQNSDQATTGIATDQLVSALQNVLGSQGGGFDLGSLVGRLQEGGLGNLAASWLGTGANAAISPDDVASFLGSGKIREFASQLGISTQSAQAAIADALPEMIDKASPGGALLENLAGNLGGFGDIVGKLF